MPFRVLAAICGRIRAGGGGAWLLPLQRLYNHGLPLAGAPTCTSIPMDNLG